MKVIDGAALINMNPPRASKSFGEYCGEIATKVKNFGKNGVKRVDLVFDIYKNNSLKSQTRENRGKGARVVVRENTPIPNDFHKFLRNDENKNELFQMLADHMVTIKNLNVVSTKMNDVVSNTEQDLTEMHPCNHEEADTRVIVHVQHGCNNGNQKIMIVTVDTDVVIIALFHFFSLNLEELWIEMGAGKNKRYVSYLIVQSCHFDVVFFVKDLS